jgi:hypothetical protein
MLARILPLNVDESSYILATTVLSDSENNRHSRPCLTIVSVHHYTCNNKGKPDGCFGTSGGYCVKLPSRGISCVLQQLKQQFSAFTALTPSLNYLPETFIFFFLPRCSHTWDRAPVSEHRADFTHFLNQDGR